MHEAVDAVAPDALMRREVGQQDCLASLACFQRSDGQTLAARRQREDIGTIKQLECFRMWQLPGECEALWCLAGDLGGFLLEVDHLAYELALDRDVTKQRDGLDQI